MADSTGIEWADATWNPVVGCTKVSPGCDHCYAETFVNRFTGTKGFPLPFDQLLLRDESFLTLPLRWREPKRIFVNSLSDLFHQDVPDAFIAQVFAVMALAPRHTFQLLTKRHGRMRSLLDSSDFRAAVALEAISRTERGAGPPHMPEHLVTPPEGQSWWPLPNVWLGVSVENQQWADIRIPALLATPAAVRWISAEPLLGSVVIAPYLVPPGVDWVVVGGESGPGARPMHPEWATSLRDECARRGVPFLFKQWGNWAPSPFDGVRRGDVCLSENGERYDVESGYICASNESDGTWLRNVGKKLAGRTLCGQTWDGYPTDGTPTRLVARS